MEDRVSLRRSLACGTQASREGSMGRMPEIQRGGPVADLKGSDRKHLRKMAHRLKPVVQVGRDGITKGLIHSVYRALDAHELIKIRFVDLKDERRELARAIAEETGSHVVGEIGNIAIVYRPHPENEKRKIALPSDPGQ